MGMVKAEVVIEAKIREKNKTQVKDQKKSLLKVNKTSYVTSYWEEATNLIVDGVDNANYLLTCHQEVTFNFMHLLSKL